MAVRTLNHGAWERPPGAPAGRAKEREKRITKGPNCNPLVIIQQSREVGKMGCLLRDPARSNDGVGGDATVNAEDTENAVHEVWDWG